MTADAHTLVTRMFEAIDARAWDRFEDIFQAEVAYFRPGYPPITGLTELVRFYDTERIIAGGEHQLETVIVGESGQIASWGHFNGITRSGAEVTQDFSEIYDVVDGRVARRRTFFYCPAI
jgi:ketosteroid isomerase-like protein